jgi:hypothetical protein
MRDAVLAADALHELVDALDRRGATGNRARYRRRSDELVGRSDVFVKSDEIVSTIK